MESIKNKIQRLLRLAESANPHEAKNAKDKATELMQKHNITSDDLKEDDSPYDREGLLYSETNVTPWKRTLAFAIAKKYDCFIVQEETTDQKFNYYLVGENHLFELVKSVFSLLLSECDKLLLKFNVGKGQDSVDSYCEGLITGIRGNLDNLVVFKNAIVSRPSFISNQPKEAIAVIPEEKVKSVSERVDVNKGSLVKDVFAYFQGIQDGHSIELEEVIDEEAWQLQGAKD